jgi:hypothetical protein
MSVSNRSAWILALLGLGLSACAQFADPAAAQVKAAPAESAPGAPVVAKANPPAAASAPAAAASATPPGPLRPFADVVKDARRTDGLFALWQKDDKVWLELKPEDLNQPFFLSSKIKTGIGENFFFGGLLGFDDGAVEFRRIHNQVQLVWLNTEYVAKAGTPEARAVAAAFSPSLLASTAVLSLPHPESKAILVEANALFVADLLGTAMELQRSYRQGYAFDARNSAITAVRNRPDVTVLEVLSHFATASIALPQPGSPPGAPVPIVPRALPDPRSLFMTMHYSLAKMPPQPLRPRLADARIGHFTTGVVDFSDDIARSPRLRYVNRWRLEKKDPSAELSEPVKPITFWLDRTIPIKYRAAVTAGVLEWNKAFEAIGFKDAIRVEQQPDDAEFDTLDFGRASIRWMTNARPAFGGIGQSNVDPRSGEILHAGIAIESLDSRNVRSVRAQILAPGLDAPLSVAGSGSASRHAEGIECNFADAAAEQLAYALELMDARGEIDPASPEAQKFVEDYVRQVTVHEVGHTLGLRHNFRASRAYTEAQLADPEFTAAHGTVASVMEYMPINLNAPGERRALYGTPFNTALGPYDYWAIEYAYRPLAVQDEAAELARIAGRSAEPLLAFGTDEDASLGLDPETLQLDLGNDVVAFARKRIAIAQDMLRRQELRVPRADQGYVVLRRSVLYAVNDVGRAAGMLARQIGGVRTVRDAPGSGRDPLQPVAAAQQREALALITGSLLAADSLQISPALQRRLGPDYLARRDAMQAGDAAGGTDFSLATQLLEMQRGLLGALMSDAVAVRLLDSAEKAGTGADRALTLSELYASLTKAVWSELAGAGEIAPLRRELQREHVNRVAALLLRPQALSRADARGLLRVQARALSAQLDAASRRRGLSPEVQAHLKDSADTLNQALSARLMRAGV